ncbi:hypothetical protein [Fuerstiella marisgermanici]|uniref:Uncharacterized protein n=1 Tax=Fuerstiella marisgermanici TaxID=1891926 RepID=A0A1P8WDT8_9PLAN|nr:hypothetical protein [Fuerstiella marisgermanici]APZ92236.1 hypothetical protein Fuma_01846 [Fuerstiella marisgermanici]
MPDRSAAKIKSTEPLAFLKLDSVFSDLAEDARFAETYERLVKQLYSNPDVSTLVRQVMDENR